jgi:serine/threonine-protein kinase RsbT
MEPNAAIEAVSSSSETTMLIASEVDIVAACQRGRTCVLQLGFSSPEAALVAAAISELARNIVLYAKQGEIVMKPLERNGRSGILIIARDEGPGIPDLRRAAIDAPRGCGGVTGLRATKRLVDEIEIDSRAGFGTRVAVKKWKW